MLQRKDLTGQVFGRWTVLGFSHNHPISGNRYWKCLCICGSAREVCGTDLIHNRTKSCGCLSAEIASKNNRTHGQNGTITYESWRCMKSRCLNENDPSYFRYAGRGITLCEPWLKFENFYADMGDRPGVDYSIDRIDNNKGYCKENCRWLETKLQCRNRRTNKWVKWEGKNILMCDLIRMYKINKAAVYGRLHRGWTLEKALLTPLKVNSYV